MDYEEGVGSFDHIDDFLDVPSLEPWSPPLPLSDSVFCDSDIFPQLSLLPEDGILLQSDDIFQMEWLDHPSFSQPPRSPSPVSVLESSTSSSSCPITSPQLPPSVLSPASELSPAVVKKKKIKFTLPAPPPATNGDGDPSIPLPVRKCWHCEVAKTPQWRAGPMGPKTLCNACGVRYKSGRLFPEYRPAASPTFVPSVHSNSHRKVLEMRTKVW
ncbi:hypothetical protein MLD38_002570 [Melastoma candidum]|uniref:Uncharacterized protein n=1 Tax=Melastoma candidum TaxID=119954 RepID=A0ACB9RZ14_9MYRT|nr:hypothetical protein MLD38_002570 [Melastoma candidum]